MGMSDYIFEALQDMDPCKEEFYSPAPGEEATDYHRRYDEFYRLVTNAMRMLMLHADQISPTLNDEAFFDRAMQMIRENDQRPWEVLCEELKAELQRPILIPPDDQGRRIVLEGPIDPLGSSPDQGSSSPSLSATQGLSPLPPSIAAEETRLIHVPTETPRVA